MNDRFAHEVCIIVIQLIDWNTQLVFDALEPLGEVCVCNHNVSLRVFDEVLYL